ncbi:Putative signal transduction protein [Escherichia coli]
MPDIDSISVAFPVKSMRSAEHFVMNATEEEARRGLTRVMVEFGELLGKVNNAGNDSNLLIVFYVQIMPDDFVMQLHRF